MSILPGIVFSRPRFTIIRTRNNPMDREVYLGNDHFIDYRVQERTTGKFTSGLNLVASLSRNPTGSAIRSFFLDTPATLPVATTSFTLGTVQIIGLISGQVGPRVTQSILTLTTQSISTHFTSSLPGTVILTASLVESPACSGQYVGTFPGLNISTALSQSLSSSFSQSLSSSIATASFDMGGLVTSGSGAGEVTTSIAFTASVTGLTSSLTQSILVQLVESDERCNGVFEIITSGTFFKATTPMTLRSVRFIP